MFPNIKTEKEDFDQWKEQFLTDAERELSKQAEIIEKKGREVKELKKGIEENEQKMNQLKSVLSNTVPCDPVCMNVFNVDNCSLENLTS